MISYIDTYVLKSMCSKIIVGTCCRLISYPIDVYALKSGLGKSFVGAFTWGPGFDCRLAQHVMEQDNLVTSLTTYSRQHKI